jgi:hypothetical protein
VQPEQLFGVFNLAAIFAWALLVLLPRREWAERLLAGTIVPSMLAAAYVVLIASNWRGSAGGFSTLDDVAVLFGNRWLLLAGWVHYLCFDLLIGCREAGDARERGVPHLFVVPCLLLTFLFGPAGWLLHQTISLRYPERRHGPASC